MSTSASHRCPPANGYNGSHPVADSDRVQAGGEEAGLDGWDEEGDLRRELERLAAEHKDLLSAAGLAGGLTDAGAAPQEAGPLREENARLRARVEELEQLVLAATQEREQAWSEQQREYEALLEEKSEVIRGLHLKIQELKQAAEVAPPAEEGAGSGDPGRLPALKEELAILRQQLERERCQLQEDEEALQEQMRNMEMTMSRERVELARQRSELQRLQSDFQHELETASRDEKLRERLMPLQRRHQEIINSKGAASAPPPRPASSAQLLRPTSTPALAQPGPGTPTPLPRKPGSGLFRRLFGGDR